MYAAAENVLLAEDDDSLSFEELLKINPDVKLWLKLDGTEIDAPVAQGKDNYYYLNRDVLCKSSMAGALFLDARNAGDFSDIYNIIYGHHMKGSLMFGDLDLYLEKDFFDKNTTGTILLPDTTKKFETVAVMKVLDSTKEIFKPSVYTDNLSVLCTFIENNAIHISADALAKLKADSDSYQVTALVTCTDGSTGTRLVLLVMTEYEKPDKPIKPVNPDDP
ncbi:MAG: class B sortase, partial [Clostridia bacterium]|nr:class B sortase [Clostridia bacterium]